MDFEWRDDYNVGIDYIDNAHKQLFQIMFRVSEILEDKNEQRRKLAIVSCVKYLTKYASSHFEQEESYMRTINYPGYKMHSMLHTNFKKISLPEMAKMMEEKHYSDEAIKRFTALVCGWLADHILIEDMAITGKVPSRWNHQLFSLDIVTRLDQEFRLFTTDLFGMNIKLFNTHYEGEYLGDDIFRYLSTYRSPHHVYKVLLQCDNSFVKYTIDRVTHQICHDLDETAILAFCEFAASLSNTAISLLREQIEYTLEDASIDTEKKYVELFKDEFPLQSLLWKADGHLIGISIKKTRI